MPNILAFRTPDESGFLVFGVSYVKYLAFDTSDGNALKSKFFFFTIKTKNLFKSGTSWIEWGLEPLSTRLDNISSGA